MPFRGMIKLKLKYQFYFSFNLGFFLKKKDYMTQKHFNCEKKEKEERKQGRRKKKR